MERIAGLRPTRSGYVAFCQRLLGAALVATVSVATAGVAHLDIVGPHVSKPTNQSVNGPVR